MERRDIHDYTKRVTTVVNAIKKSDIRARNKQILEKYYRQLRIRKAAGEVSDGRIAKHLNHLYVVAKILDKDFDKVKKTDIEDILLELNDRKYSAYTITDYKIILKKFYNWLGDCPPKKYPECIAWLSTVRKDEEWRDPASDMTPEEVALLAKAAEHPRDKAFVWVLYETAARIGELMDVKMKHLTFGKVSSVKIWGEKVHKWRELPIVDARADLATWIDVHPNGDDPEAYLWVSIGSRNHNGLMSYHSARMLLRRLREKAGLNKPTNPHSFRHSRLSFLGDYLTEAQLSEVAGWKQGTKQAKTYVRPKRTKQAIMGIYGINIDKEEEKKRMEPKKCSVCTMINAPESKYCRHCGTVIDMETAIVAMNKMRAAEKIEGELYQKPQIVDLAVSALQHDEGLAKKLKETYPGYWKLTEQVVAREAGG